MGKAKQFKNYSPARRLRNKIKRILKSSGYAAALLYAKKYGAVMPEQPAPYKIEYTPK